MNKTVTFNSTSSLSTLLADVSNVYIYPPICFFGVLTNLISISVLASGKLTGMLYQYMLLHSICDFSALLLRSVTFIVKCGDLCSYGYSYWSKVYEFGCFSFMSNFFITSTTYLDITVSIDRILSFSSKPSKFKSCPLIYKAAVISVLSLLINSIVYIIPKTISLLGLLALHTPANRTVYQELYQIKNNDIGKLKFYEIFNTCLLLFRGFISLSVLLILNIIIGFMLRNRMRKRDKIVALNFISKKFNFNQFYVL